MKILCLNTAFPSAYIILENEGKIIKKILDANAKTSEKVLPVIEEILTEENLTPKELDYISVVVGPGSFTGIRIGVAITKGFLSCFKNLKAIAINSLELMAFEYKKQNPTQKFACVLNALSNRFFVEEFDANAQKLDEAKLVYELPKTHLIGIDFENLEITNKNISFNIDNLLEYTKKLIEKGYFASIENLNPVYLRLSQAEENLLNKGQNEN